MPIPLRYSAPPLIAGLLFLQGTALFAEDRSTSTVGTTWDNAVNSLLATGLYGFDSSKAPGLTVQLQHADTFSPSLGSGRSQLNSQAITFSYEGSSGLLEFSAGYILSTQQDNQHQGTIFLGVDPQPDKDFDPGRSWYLALDLSHSYQVDDNLAFTLGNRAMLLRNPFDTEGGHIFSMLFNMPISYKNYLTITPELQWSRPFTRSEDSASSVISGATGEPSADDVFYGGISITFSY